MIIHEGSRTTFVKVVPLLRHLATIRCLLTQSVVVMKIERFENYILVHIFLHVLIWARVVLAGRDGRYCPDGFKSSSNDCFCYTKTAEILQVT